MRENTEFTLARDCEAIQIPSGETITLKAGTPGVITQSLGGSYTVATSIGLSRVAGKDADALGLDAQETPQKTEPAEPAGEVDEKAVWAQLKTCYDPEIPVNIVDLGLVYDCNITPLPEGAKVNVKMTLTAPGCGMGPAICAEARSKILTIPGVADADVDLVWDPAWNQGMISETGKMQLGMI